MLTGTQVVFIAVSQTWFGGDTGSQILVFTVTQARGATAPKLHSCGNLAPNKFI